MRDHILLVVLALSCGCISAPAVTTTTTLESTTTSTTITYSITSSTTTTLQVNETVRCVQVAEKETLYRRCKLLLTGKLSMPPDERRLCGEIQKNPREYMRQIIRERTGCEYLIREYTIRPESQYVFCSEIEEQDVRDDCYMSVRMCDKIVDRGLRDECSRSTSLN
ncbi:MAG: hypothetical protein V1744_08450 [Candidatus Altiarchaeota archaeon]